MIALVNEFTLAVAASVAALIVLKATVVAALGLFGAWLLRARRAALRHAVLAAAFLVLLVSPGGAIFAPPIRIAVQPASLPAAAAIFSSSMDSSRDTAAPLTIGTPSMHTPSFPLSTLLLAVWLCGMALFLTPVAIGVWQVDRIRRSALPWGRAQSAARALASECSIGRRADVAIHEALPGPMTCGILRPAIVFPRDAESWSGEELNRALIHELEHVRRCDWIIHCVARAVCAAYWFHPLVWMAWRRLALEAERACDDAVLGRSEGDAYADQLVRLAKRLQSPAKTPLLAMASRADLGARVRAVLDSRQPRGRAGLRAVALTSAAAVSLALTISPLRVAYAAQSLDGADWQTQAGRKITFEVASVKPSAGPVKDLMFCIGPCAFGERFSVVGPSVNIRFMSLYNLVLTAYRIKPNQLSGPDWMQSQRFDIMAKIRDGASKDQVPEMLQALLSERFNLAIHRDRKDQSVFALLLGRNGLKLQKAAAEADVSAPGTSSGQPLYTPQGEARQMESGDIVITNGAYGPMRGGRGSNGIMRWEFVKLTMPALAALLAPHLDRPVVDLTNLTDSYRFVFQNQPPSDRGAPSRKTNTPPDESSDASNARPNDAFGEGLIQAIERAGLKLEARRAPVEMIVVDRLEKTPTAN